MTTPAFKKIATGASKGLVLSPILNNYLHGAKYPKEFSVTFRNHGAERKPDGYFHPSTHPSWTDRQLYYYLTEPKKIQTEPLEYAGALSVTMGTAVHDFVEMCLITAGALQEPHGTCVCCGREHGKKKGQCAEWGVMDEVTKTRGHTDGRLTEMVGWGGFEFKTSNMMKLGNVDDNDVERFKEKWPQYWLQVQEYMRCSGLERYVVLFLGMGYPWTTREFVIPRDDIHCYKMTQRYAHILECVERGTPPVHCCSPASATARACPARMSCPVGLL